MLIEAEPLLETAKSERRRTASSRSSIRAAEHTFYIGNLRGVSRARFFAMVGKLDPVCARQFVRGSILGQRNARDEK